MMTSGYNIEDLVQEAQLRWLTPMEILFILQNFEQKQINNEPPQKPPSGSLFLFNKKVLRFFRRDGHNWRRKTVGRTVGEAHERLKIGNVEVLNCYYAHGELNPSFQRRSYSMLEPGRGMDHIVLVHYREVTQISSSLLPNKSERSVAFSSPSSQSTPTSFHLRDYDVFLSFRGQDTSKTFVDHLYEALQQQGISTHLDDDGHSSTSKAIEQSKIAVIVFSKNYADSSWCLDQLACIMKCRDERGQTVLSVFYDVDPSEVRHQRGKYGEAFQIHELENKKIVQSWRKSLTDAACISGWEVNQRFDGCESRCIKEIVDTISHILHPVFSSPSEDLIEKETHIQDLKSNLGGSHDCFDEGSRIIITTRDVHLLNADEVDVLNNISLLDHNEAVEAFHKNGFFYYNIPVKDYELLWKGYKYLLHLSCIDLCYMHGIVVTPDFGGVPCVQVLKLRYCSSLEEIHPSLGHHDGLVHLSVLSCHKLKMLPTITGMKNLKGLEILDCDTLYELPEIHAIIDRHWSILTADTIAAFSCGLSSCASSYPIPAIYSQWRNYDIFLSFIGQYDSKTFVDHLYSTFIQQGIHTYKSDETLPQSDLLGPSLVNAIEDSQIAIIIFTKHYARSSRCLDELLYIMRCIDMRGLHIMPIFYDVSSSDVQEQNGEFGEEFAKQELQNMVKVESWRKALKAACNHSGWSLKHIANRHEGRYINDIVATVSHRLFSLILKVKKDLIGIEPRSKSLTSKLAIGSDDVRMVLVEGIGGSGKTTIASCVYMEISRQFEGRCFVENIREESNKYGLKKLQQKILSSILKKEVDIPSDEEGLRMIQSMLCDRKVLIVLDDVIDPHQLELLAGSHDWFGRGSRIIITSREGHGLSYKVDALYHVSLLSDNEAIKLFRRHAYPGYNFVGKGKRRPSSSSVEAYDTLSQHVISYTNGLPLTLKVLGSFLYNKDKHEWISALTRLRDIPGSRMLDKLKVSYDGLQPDEKDLFLDIACFFKGKPVDSSMMLLLDAFHVHLITRLNVLVQKSLVSITNGMFGMHDLVEEMGHCIVRGEHPKHPERHTRVWRWCDVADICDTRKIKEISKIEALYAPNYDAPPNLLKVVSNMKSLRLLNVCQHVQEVIEEPLFLSDALRWITWENYPASSFPASFQPTMLSGLILRNGLQKVLWRDLKYLPRLKVLDLQGSKNLIMTPDFIGLKNLERLVLSGCSNLKEIHRSIGYHERLVHLNLDRCEKLEVFPPIVRMRKLETLILSRCSRLLKFPEIKRTMNGLKHLYMDYSGIEAVSSTVGQYCINLIFINLIGCDSLKSIEGNFQQLKRRCVILVDALS